jgi:excisionase family DNA binding protein
MSRAAPRAVSAVGFAKTRNGPQSATLHRFYTIQDVSAALEVSSRTVSRWIARGDLIAHQLGRSIRIADDDLRVFLARGRGE